VRAAVLRTPGPIESGPRLSLEDVPLPEPGPNQVRVRVEACGVCHTDLHVVEGELPPIDPAEQPLRVPGHQVVGRVEALGARVEASLQGRRVGLGWLGWTDGTCQHCRAGRENLCPAARFTGYQAPGGYAEACLADADFVYPLPESADAVQLAPLLCAGVVGYRALRLSHAQPGGHLGLYGFGASAHLVLQIAIRQLGSRVSVFTRGDEHRQLAQELGATWVGGAEDPGFPGGELDAAIIFAPAGGLVPLALRALGRGGRLVLAGIYMSPIPQLDYGLIWHERSIQSVANATRDDARELLALTEQLPLRMEVEPQPLAAANATLARLKAGQIRGAAVLVP
jgi:alcohol dehydrogenase, propanol-preferring